MCGALARRWRWGNFGGSGIDAVVVVGGVGWLKGLRWMGRVDFGLG